jgi:hypothetical protein
VEFRDPLTGGVAQVAGEAFPVAGCGRLPWGQERQRLAYLLDREPYALGRPDHRYPAQDVGEEPALIPGGSLTGQQSLVVVPAHGLRRDAHPPCYLTDGQAGHMPVVFHEGDGSQRRP